ncbi:MAG: hypothetical protein R2712_22400 [Vicinamibacterales bacterium]
MQDAVRGDVADEDRDRAGLEDRGEGLARLTARLRGHAGEPGDVVMDDHDR